MEHNFSIFTLFFSTFNATALGLCYIHNYHNKVGEDFDEAQKKLSPAMKAHK